jgi:AraC-like DNA-binding protein
MTVSDEARRMLESHPDFILLKRFDFSLAKACAAHPEGLPEKLVAQALGTSPSWVTRRYGAIVKKLRAAVVDV